MTSRPSVSGASFRRLGDEVESSSPKCRKCGMFSSVEVPSLPHWELRANVTVFECLVCGYRYFARVESLPPPTPQHAYPPTTPQTSEQTLHSPTVPEIPISSSDFHATAAEFRARKASETRSAEMLRLASLRLTRHSDFTKQKELMHDVIYNRHGENKQLFLHMPMSIVITFVEAIERSQFYFDFKDYLENCNFIKHNSNSKEVFDMLFNMQRLHTVFKKVENEDLVHAIEERISKVRTDREADMRHDYVNYLAECEFITSVSSFLEDMREIEKQNKFPEISSHDRARGLRVYKDLLIFSHPDDDDDDLSPVKLERNFYCNGFHLSDRQEEPIASNPIDKLVLDTRKGCRVMDLNPEVEIRHIKKCDPYFFENYFIDWKAPLEFTSVPTKMVKVVGAPHGIFVKEVKSFFEKCGETQYVRISRGDKVNKTQDVNIVFKEVGAVKAAAALSGHEMKAQGKQQTVRVISYPDLPVPISERPKPKEIVSAGRVLSAVEAVEDDGSLLAQILAKYWHYCRSHVEAPFNSHLYEEISS